MVNNLLIIDNGKLDSYQLDEKLVWEVGRSSKDNNPDIKLHTSTISRKHGKFQNVDGVWFYIDNKSKNGTVYNNKQIESGLNGRIRPIMLNDGDIFIFGGGDKPSNDNKNVWGLFTTKRYNDNWQVVNTRGYDKICIQCDMEKTILENPSRGTAIRSNNSIAIYMGDITYLSGNTQVAGISNR